MNTQASSVSSNRLDVNTRSSTRRHRQYAKFASIGKACHDKSVQSDSVAKKLEYDSRSSTRASSSSSHKHFVFSPPTTRSQKRKLFFEYGDNKGSSPGPTKRLLYSPVDTSNIAIESNTVLSPLASFSANVGPRRSTRNSSRSKNIDLAKIKARNPVFPSSGSPQSCHKSLSSTKVDIVSPSVKQTYVNPNHEQDDKANIVALEGFSPCVFHRVTQTHDDSPLKMQALESGDAITSQNSTPMKVMISFITGYQDGEFQRHLSASNGTRSTNTAVYMPIIMSPAQDAPKPCENNIFGSPWSFPGWVVGETGDCKGFAEHDTCPRDQHEIDIQKLDAELGEFYLFDYF